ncbi:hypothetical protein COCCADRAFT_85008, partial [Bipolaris zeicola 26-R-13]
YFSGTYGHRFKKFSHPVRSGLYKLEIGGLVVRWVTTGESPLSYVFFAVFASSSVFLNHVTCVLPYSFIAFRRTLRNFHIYCHIGCNNATKLWMSTYYT